MPKVGTREWKLQKELRDAVQGWKKW